MCLEVFNELVVKVAEADIPCFKVLTRFRASPYQHYQYPEAGVAVRSELDTEGHYQDKEGAYWQLNVGLHSFAELDNAIYEANDWGLVGMTVWHAVIPAGSRYIEGFFSADKAYMSEALVLVKEQGTYNGFNFQG